MSSLPTALSLCSSLYLRSISGHYPQSTICSSLYLWTISGQPATYPPPLPPDPNKRGPGAAIRAVHHHHPTGEVPLSPQLTYPFTALQELSASPTSSSPSSPSSPTPPSLLVYSLSPTSLPVSPSPSLPPRTSLFQDFRPKSLYFKMEHLWLSK